MFFLHHLDVFIKNVVYGLVANVYGEQYDVSDYFSRVHLTVDSLTDMYKFLNKKTINSVKVHTGYTTYVGFVYWSDRWCTCILPK